MISYFTHLLPLSTKGPRTYDASHHMKAFTTTYTPTTLHPQRKKLVRPHIHIKGFISIYYPFVHIDENL
jgi:hypothetical protein